ncbi:MAG: MFS transporter, partial [Chloroflexi bacterium]|nr:MFS transporter [Chloroflexota bacterium]
VTKPLFAFANTWPLVLFIRVIERIGKGIRTAPRDAIVADSCEECVRGKVFGFHRAADGIGSTLGAIIAFSLLTVMDYKDIFLLAFIPGILSVFAILFVKERYAPAPARAGMEPLHVSLKALPMNLRLFIIVSALFAFGQFGYAFLLLKAHDIGLADDRAILLYAFFYVIYTLCSIPSGALSDRIGRKPILIGGYVMFAITSLGLVFASSGWTLLVFFGTYGVFFAMIDGVQRALVVDLSPPHLKATALGTFHTAIGLAALPGGIVAGLLWDRISPESTFIYGLALAILSMALFVFVRTRNPR